MKLKGVRGEVLTFKADPFVSPAGECYDYYPDGLVVMCDGMIVAVGDYARVAAEWPGLLDVDEWSDALIMPGFVDCHLHYVQSPMVGSYGDTLLNWLNRYVFPVEARFRDKDYAKETARMFFRQLLRNGTTTANVFATTFEESVDALFEESERHNTRIIAGKVLQDRNLPDSLMDKDAEESVAVAERLLNRWHGRGRQLYAVIPRFAPTSTPRQLRMAGELYQKYIDRGVYMHTHLDEAEGEIEWVKSLYPEASNYTDVYDRFGLVDRLSVMAHCCIVRPEEWRRLHEAGCGVVHCPSSNLFLGDGVFRHWEAKNPARPCPVGIGTDVGGGTSFSVVRQLGEAYKVGMLGGHALDALRSYYMATLGGAQALHLEDKVGTLQPGTEADLVVLDMKPTEFVEWRMRGVESVFDRLFILQTLAPDNLVLATYVAGEKKYKKI